MSESLPTGQASRRARGLLTLLLVLLMALTTVAVSAQDAGNERCV